MQRTLSKLYLYVFNKSFLKLQNKNINKFYVRCSSLLSIFSLSYKHQFTEDLLISFTRVSMPYIFSTKNINHISITESWDHPMRSPYFIVPDYCLTWNNYLKKDIKEYQNLSKVGLISPLKFRYINERAKQNIKQILEGIKKEEYINEITKIKNKSYVLYPVTTSSVGFEHLGELKLIEDLCIATKSVDQLLYIKPKPNGPKGDYDIFKKYDHVIVGKYSSNIESDDMLDEEYHSFRYLLLYYSRSVVNAGTTFVLEAAMMKKPIIQLNLMTEKFGGFRNYSQNIHLKKYILNDLSFKYYGIPNELGNELANVKMSYQKYLEDWIDNRN